MRSRIFIFTMLLVFAIAGCSVNQLQDQSSPSIKNEVASTPTKLTDNEDDTNFNPYNYATESDGKHVFYSVRTGIYRIPNGANGAEKVIDGQTIISITLHDSTIYYNDDGNLCRVGKDGTNQKTFDIKHYVLRVACLNDVLYIGTLDGYYTANIASDPDVLMLEKQPKGHPAPNGIFYSMESIPNTEIGSNLYRISPDTGKKTEILHDVYYEYIITDRFIFFHDRDGIYRADLEGRNNVKIVDKNDIDIGWINFHNYDDQWIYAGINPGGLSRLNQETGDIEYYDTNPGDPYDIVDGYMYGYHSGEKVRMKLPEASLEFAPFK